MQQISPQYDVGIIVGRSQTHQLHEGHRDLIEHVCAAHEKVIIFLGVSPLWATKSNPLDFQARKQMISEVYPDVLVQYINDAARDDFWSGKLDSQVAHLVTPSQSVVLYGSRDSFIKHYKGKHPTAELESEKVFSGTHERNLIASGNTRATADFRAGVIWATQARYPTPYQTVDVAIIEEDGRQVLLARKAGESLFRFIGGFVDVNDQSLEDAAVREAVEETGLEIDDVTYIDSIRVDDWRYRAERDKIMTSLFVATRIFGHARPGDDVEEVRWFDLNGLNTAGIVAEHHPLVYMLNRYLGKD